MIGKLIKKYKEIIMYLIFGVLTTLVNWFCYAFLTKSGMEMNISNCIAWLVAVLFAFITNKVFVFESKNMEMRFVCRELMKQSLFGVEGFVAKIVVSVVVVLLNYVFSKLFIFRIKKEN